jgi:branched-chain amino acid transport system permease protein
MIVGGAGSFLGPIIGAAFLTLVPEVARPLKSFMPLLFAAILMVIIFFMPEGLVGLPRRLSRLLGRRPARGGGGAGQGGMRAGSEPVRAEPPRVEESGGVV